MTFDRSRAEIEKELTINYFLHDVLMQTCRMDQERITTMDEIADELRKTRRQVHRAMHELKALGLVRLTWCEDLDGNHKVAGSGYVHTLLGDDIAKNFQQPF